jgi:hypothetical protein
LARLAILLVQPLFAKVILEAAQQKLLSDLIAEPQSQHQDKHLVPLFLASLEATMGHTSLARRMLHGALAMTIRQD